MKPFNLALKFGTNAILFLGVTISALAADVNLESPSGRQFVGNQLKTFAIEADGALRAERDSQINLYYTEGMPFRLTGKVWLAGVSETLDHPADLPDGMALFLREWDSLHRYSLTSREAIVKRRLLGGAKQRKIVAVAGMDAPKQGEWITFSVEATPRQIVYHFGDKTAVIDGPLDMDGANKIVLARNSKLKEVQLEILAQDTTQTADKNTAPSSVGSPATGGTSLRANLEAGGQIALSFHAIPGNTYRLQFKNSLSDPIWTPLGEPLKATNADVVLHDDGKQPSRFYSLAEQP